MKASSRHNMYPPRFLLRQRIFALIVILFKEISAFSSRLKRCDRRSAIADIVSTSIVSIISGSAQPSWAVHPFAPLDALLPATRVKLTVDRAVDISAELMSEKDDENMHIRLKELEKLLLVPQNYNQRTKPIDVPQQPAKSYLDSYSEYRSKVSLLEKPGAVLVQNGEIDAWRRLKREERVREDADEVRAALNYYTSNLNFDSDKIALTGTKEERSKMIREDRIPDVKTVIASEMGLRYLLRNDVLTAIDDARAEVKYQMKQPITDVDGKEIYDLLIVAQSACEKWFDLIDKKDVAAALDAVRKEKL